MTDPTDVAALVERAIEAALCQEAGREVGAIWRSERGRKQVTLCARAAIAAMPALEALAKREAAMREALEAITDIDDPAGDAGKFGFTGLSSAKRLAARALGDGGR